MGKIVVFDSGLGSLSIIKAIQKTVKSDIVYLADQKNFPYGKKSVKELDKIITDTIRNLKKEFNPDLIVVGSNTPSLLINKIFLNNDNVIGVLPPLLEAQQITQTKSIALLVTRSVAQSALLNQFIKKNLIKKIKIIKIDASELIDLVESGAFIQQKNICIEKITSILQQVFRTNNVDVVTLSSTHLPFLLPFLQKIFPHITFLDPAYNIANQILNHKLFSPSPKNKLTIFTSGDVKIFQTNLQKIGIKNIVHQIKF